MKTLTLEILLKFFNGASVHVGTRGERYYSSDIVSRILALFGKYSTGRLLKSVFLRNLHPITV